LKKEGYYFFYLKKGVKMIDIKYSRVKQIFRTAKNKIKKDKRIKYPLK